MKTKIAILGYKGFLGSHIFNQLRKYTEYELIEYEKRYKYDFVKQKDTEEFYGFYKPDIVVNCLGFVGGIGLNQKYPAKMFYDNLQMNLNVIHYAYKYEVKKFVQIGTICSYPKFTPVPFLEDYLWMGFPSNYPEETNAPYGIAKRVLLTMLQAYRQQYNFNGIYLMPTNLYGPSDHFEEEKSHVIPALIKRIYEAKKNNQNEIICWGTGMATRDFLYVEDAAEGIIKAIEIYNKSDPINLGSGQEYSIKEIVEIICSLMAYKGKIIWDTSKPDGQPRRCLDITKAKELLGFEPKTTLAEGLKKTIEWFLKNQEGNNE